MSESSVCLPYTSNYISVFVHYVFVYVINVHMPILRTIQWTKVVGVVVVVVVVVVVDDDVDDDVSQHRAWIIVSVIIILDLPNCKLIKLVDKTLIWQQGKMVRRIWLTTLPILNYVNLEYNSRGNANLTGKYVFFNRT